jgi:hypothetical protein
VLSLSIWNNTKLTNRTLSKFTFSGFDSLTLQVTVEASMTEADFSNKGLEMYGTVVLAGFLPKCK